MHRQKCAVRFIIYVTIIRFLRCCFKGRYSNQYNYNHYVQSNQCGDHQGSAPKYNSTSRTVAHERQDCRPLTIHCDHQHSANEPAIEKNQTDWIKNIRFSGTHLQAILDKTRHMSFPVVSDQKRCIYQWAPNWIGTCSHWKDIDIKKCKLNLHAFVSVACPFAAFISRFCSSSA